MEDTLIASYITLIIGYLILDDKVRLFFSAEVFKLVQPLVTVTHDHHCSICLGHFGPCDTNRMRSICVVIA
jgi:hypothetical protein